MEEHNSDDETLPPSQRPRRGKQAEEDEEGNGGDIQPQQSWAKRGYDTISKSAKTIGAVMSQGVNLLTSTIRDEDDLDVDEHDDSPAAVAKRAAIESVAPAPRAVLPLILLNDAPASVRLLPEGLLPTPEEEEDDEKLLLRTLRQVEVDSGHMESIGAGCCAGCLAWYVNFCGCEFRFSGRCWCPSWCTWLIMAL